MKLGIAAFGLLLGVTLGLSGSPVVAALVTAIAGLAAVAVPALVDRSAKTQGLNIPDCFRVLTPFSLAALVGVLLGIMIRTNGWLDLRNPSIRVRLMSQGFNQIQVDNILQRAASNLKVEIFERERPAGAHPWLLSSDIGNAGTGKSTLYENLRQVGGAVQFVELLSSDAVFAQEIAGLRNEGKNDSEIAIHFLLKD